MLLGIWQQPTATKFTATITQEKLFKGKVTRNTIDVYIDLEKGQIIKESKVGKHTIMKTNALGEMEIYFPKSNTVIRKRSTNYSADNEILYYLLKHKDYNLGISKAGAKKFDTEMDDGTMVTRWTPPKATQDMVKEVKLVFKDNLPIYTSYTKPSGEKHKETFYYQYKKVNNLPIPTKITEHLYTKGEKITQRITYANIMAATGTKARFSFSVPKSATLIKDPSF